MSKRLRKIKLRLLEEQKWRCAYCGRDLDVTCTEIAAIPTLDHYIPLCQGGGRSLENLVVACLACNQQKAATDYWPMPKTLEGRIAAANETRTYEDETFDNDDW